MKRLEVLHILGSAGYEGTSVAHVVRTLHVEVDPERYRLSACFLGEDGPLATEFEDAGIPCRVLGWREGARDPAGAFRFARQLAVHRFDIIHQHQGARSVNWLARRFSAGRVIVHLHGQTRRDLPSPSNTLIAASGWIANEVHDRDCKVIYPGIRPTEPAVHAASQRVVGMAARLVEGKGIHDLLQAMATVPGEIEIAGDGPLRTLSSRVAFRGWCRDIPDLMRHWAIAAMPSLNEGFGMTALEAMAAGVPVVGYRSGALPEVVADGETGVLVAPGDISALSEAISRLPDDPDLRRRMGLAGQARVRSTFDPARMAREISAVYEDQAALAGYL